jgi:pimeloyl-ACP methyl ester carboxylesterase
VVQGRAIVAVALALAVSAGAADPRETVVLLHGLGRSDAMNAALAERLEADGYRVVNVDYPSTQLTPDELGPHLAGVVAACCADAPRLHFVTHSMGGIMVRAYLADTQPPNLGRVVMVAPPNRGSEIVDTLGSELFRQTLGPTAAELGTAPGSLPNRLPAPTYEVGVIAGTASVNPLGSLMVPGADDGRVAIERTKLDGMTDFVTVDASHTFIMSADETARQVRSFLRDGRFVHDPPAPAAPR